MVDGQVEELRKIDDGQVFAAELKRIVGEYIREGSISQVNISSHTRKDAEDGCRRVLAVIRKVRRHVRWQLIGGGAFKGSSSDEIETVGRGGGCHRKCLLVSIGASPRVPLPLRTEAKRNEALPAVFNTAGDLDPPSCHQPHGAVVWLCPARELGQGLRTERSSP